MCVTVRDRASCMRFLGEGKVCMCVTQRNGARCVCLGGGKVRVWEGARGKVRVWEGMRCVCLCLGSGEVYVRTYLYSRYIALCV